MSLRKIIFVLIFSTFYIINLFSANVLFKDYTNQEIVDEVYQFDNAQQEFQLTDLVDQIRSEGIDSIESSQFTTGSPDYNIWIVFHIKENTNLDQIFLEYDYEKHGKKIELFSFNIHDPSGKITQINEFKNDQLHLRNITFKIDLQNTIDTYYILQFSSLDSLPFITDLRVSLNIWELASFIDKTKSEQLLFGIILGTILAMVAYNFFLFVSLRSSGYLYFSIFILVLGVLQLNTYGVVSYILPAPEFLGFVISALFPSLVGLSFFLFSEKLLRLRKNFPKLSVILFFQNISLLLITFIFLIFNTLWVNEVRNLLLLLGLFSIIGLAVSIAIRGYRPALIFLIASGSFLLFAVAGLLMQLDILPYSNALSHIMDLGLMVMIVLLAIGMAAHVTVVRQEKERVAQESLAKSVFLANMSHEMRTPLNGILGFADLIEETDNMMKIKKHNKLIIKESQRLLFLISQLLELSKIERGAAQLNVRPFSIATLMNSIESSFQTRARNKNLEFSISIELDHDWYEGDPDRLEQVLVNLVGNAVKFTEQGKIEVKIKKEADAIVFSVYDTGIGIPKMKKNNLFQPFVQADPSITRKYGGTGLGTTISKQLVELMGGKIDFEPNEPNGTIFWFKVSLEKTAPTEETKDAGKMLLSPIGLSITNPILIVEDYPTNIQILLHYLEEITNAVETAVNGEEAVEMSSKKKYELIFMDIRMPEMDGFEATRIIRKNHNVNSTTPIIGVTADAYEKAIEECLESGMNDIITKPIKKSVLHTKVFQWLNNEKATKALNSVSEINTSNL